MRRIAAILVPVLAALAFAPACGDGDGRNGGEPTATPEDAAPTDIGEAPTAEPTAGERYRNEQYGFELRYPAAGALVEEPGVIGVPPQRQFERGVRIDLPAPTGTTLSDKYVLVTTSGGSGDACAPPEATGASQTGTATFNGVEFSTYENRGAAAGNFWDVTTYWTSRDGACILVDAVLHSINPGMVAGPTPLPFDRDEQAADLVDVVSTFRWVEATSKIDPVQPARIH